MSSPAARLDGGGGSASGGMDAIALNLSLEFALGITLRAEAASSEVVFVGTDGAPPQFLTVANISELLCGRLYSSSSAELHNAVHYLTGCYKRILVKETSASPKTKEDLLK